MQIDHAAVHDDCRRVEERLQTLLEATRRLSESIDYRQTLANVVDFVAERFASYALLDIIAENGRIERVAVAHGDPARAHLAGAIARFNPVGDAEGPHPVARAIARGESTLEAIDERWIAEFALDPDHAEMMRRLEMRTLLIVPVLARAGDVLGALTCALDAHAPRAAYDPADVAFARELGRRAGVAIENARLFEHERRIAVALQSASLPAVLPRVHGLRLDANYRPGRTEATIGGDWYDAFELHDGRVVFTIGDVVGNGLAAAVTMTKIRQAMQAAAMLRPEPDAMLDVAERTLRLHDPGGYATALAAVYESWTGTLRIASAGHPPPLLVADGRVTSCAVRGLMLGVNLGTVRATVPIAARRGTSFVFFTDGLTEMDGHFDVGDRRLHEAVGRRNIMRLPRPAAKIVDTVLGGARFGHIDDIALMTVSIV